MMAKSFSRQGRQLQFRFPTVPLDQVIRFFLEEIQRQVLLGFEIVEEGSLGNTRFLGDLFGGRSVQSVFLK